MARVRARISAAAVRSGRAPEAVRLVAVTKSVGFREVVALSRAGVADFGENRPDELGRKRSEARRTGIQARWHLIGHVQTNKLRRALPDADVLHSLDRPSLLEALARELARGSGPRLPALLQVNVSGEATKGGYAPQDVPSALAAARAVPRLAVCGLMTMAPLSDDAAKVRPVFRRLQELRDAARSLGYLEVLDLSMGMSQDFEAAIEEGATLVRVGSLLFSD